MLRSTVLQPHLLRRATALPPPERVLLLALTLLIVLAVLLPATALPPGYHDFADQRTLAGIPHALDVWSNLAFALVGAWGLLRLSRLPANGIGRAQRGLATLTSIGLMTTAFCSAGYHLAPQDAGLCVDRLGMSVAFAGLLGLAAADRIGPRAGWTLAWMVLLVAPATALIAWWIGNLTPWAVLQGGGLLVLCALALRQPQPGALGFSIAAVIACYMVAKALEMADATMFAFTHHTLSGHSAKHLVAALAAWPVVRALSMVAMPVPHQRAHRTIG